MIDIDLSAMSSCSCCGIDCSSVPADLYATVSPNCSPGINSPQLIVRSGSTWSGGATTSCGPPGSGWQVSITCNGDGTWSFVVNDGGGDFGGGFTPTSLSPFSGSFQYDPTGPDGCCYPVQQTVSITE